MTNAVKAMLLSGLVYPGVGQVVLKFYARGGALILVTSVCLYVLMENVVQQAMDIASRIDISSGVLDERMIATAISEAGKAAEMDATRWVVWTLLVLWLIGIVDAYVVGRKMDSLTPSVDRGK